LGSIFHLEAERNAMMLENNDISLLIDIVKKDMDILEKRKFLDEAPAKIKDITKKIEEMEGELSDSQESLDKLEEERRHLEREVSSQNDKIVKKRKEQNSVKTNKEYKALGHEIQYLTGLVDKEEERILSILEMVEVKRKEIRVISDKISSERDSLIEEKNMLERNIKESEDALKILDDEKLRKLTHLSDRVRKLYLKILKAKHDSGVANLVGDICQGCYSRVPPQMAHEVRKNEKILTCEVCGRILVHYESE